MSTVELNIYKKKHFTLLPHKTPISLCKHLIPNLVDRVFTKVFFQYLYPLDTFFAITSIQNNLYEYVLLLSEKSTSYKFAHTEN